MLSVCIAFNSALDFIIRFVTVVPSHQLADLSGSVAWLVLSAVKVRGAAAAAAAAAAAVDAARLMLSLCIRGSSF
jgi:hypothetical protein